MVEQKIRLTRPFLPGSALPEMNRILESGFWTQGLKVAVFEKMLAEYLEVEHVVVVSSGTAALHLALLALDIRTGDEVIIPAFSFAATANVVKICGATPVFVDIRTEDCCLNIDLLEEAVTPRTKAIMPVHEFGAVAEMDAILQIAQRYGLKVIEDAACALGSLYKNRKAGTMGDIGCYSFHPRKIITTGEGGALVTNSKELAEKFRKLRNHGSSGNPFADAFVLTGLNYRMTEFQALLGIEQLRLIAETIDERQRQAEYYQRELGKVLWLALPRIDPAIRATFQSYHLLIKNGKREQLSKYLRDHHIECNLGAQFLPGLPSLSDLRIDQKKYPEALQAYQNGLVIPIGRHLAQSDLNYIISTIKEFENELSC